MGDEKEQPKEESKLKKYARRYAIPAVLVILGGLYQQGYISQDVYEAILRTLAGALGFGR